MQTITVAGRIGRDAETRPAGSDNVTSFTVAVDQRNGRDKTTNWWRVSIWGKRGEALAQYLRKGDSVTVSGEFSVSEYEGKTQLNIRAYEIALQGGGQRGGNAGSAAGGSSGGAGGGSSNFGDDLNDMVPF